MGKSSYCQPSDQSLKFRTYMLNITSGPLVSTNALGSMCSHKLHMCTWKHVFTQILHVHCEACAHTNSICALGSMRSHKLHMCTGKQSALLFFKKSTLGTRVIVWQLKKCLKPLDKSLHLVLRTHMTAYNSRTLS